MAVPMKAPEKERNSLLDEPVRPLLFIGTLLLSAFSFIGASDVPVWIFELSMAWVGIAILLVTWNRFRFSTLFYGTVLLHFLVLAIGAKYSYAEAPPGFWLQDLLGLDRNPFDRVGHFFQGVTPALLVRELLIRTTPLGKSWALPVATVSTPLAFSAFYEMVEWWIVIFFYPESGPEWLGHQGDPWDAQQDMLMALCGALLVALILRPFHDRSIRAIPSRKTGEATA